MFYIQISNPRIKNSDLQVTDLSEAVEEIFDLYTESALIFLNSQILPLSYKYDISEIIYDVVEIVEFLESCESGEKTVQFASSSFSYTWTIRMLDGIALIDVDDEIAVASGQRQIDDGSRKVVINRCDILCELASLVKFVLLSVEKSGIKIDDEKDMDRLRRIASEVQCDGVLYRSK